ncbi:hypothetical protein [Jeotgalibacillus haloalkalitolerans]|uniref:Flagellar protein FliT n=1 Tax=Jeotgalibacillus haloalkalitolerans TaxID=3104292 RepID=A0ABU5KJR6_9BACL|nr:hypothetical protein [Jeotgalibacillus sp. HH7-29]MDZ5711486.1 hypothetical protein [Jeotgalibacillus sp. HH7-29]
MSLAICHRITRELFDVVNEQADTERDEIIEKVTSLLNEREVILAQVQKPVTPEDEVLAREIIQWNKVIEAELANIKLDIQKKIKQTGDKKQTAAKYNNPYANAEAKDGIYYDKRN